MGKIDKLRDSIISADKNNFIDSIFDFSEEDIIGLTEQEFKEIIESSSKIKLDGIEEFFKFLFDEGTHALNPENEYIKMNILISRFYLSIFLALYSKQDRNYAIVAVDLGRVHRMLAEIGVDPKKNIGLAIKFHQEVRKKFRRKDLEYIAATSNLGIDLNMLADLGVDPEKNLIDSIKLQEEACALSDGLKDAQTIMNIGIAYLSLAQNGVEPKKNLDKSIKLLKEARKICTELAEKTSAARAALNQGLAHLWLAMVGTDSENNLKECITLQNIARENFPKNDIDFGRATMNQGSAYLHLAELGVDPKDNLEQSIKLEQEAKIILPTKGMDYAGATIIEGHALMMYARLGIDPKNNLEEAIKLQKIVMDILPENFFDYAAAAINQGLAHLLLAELGVKPEDNLNKSIKLQQKAIEIYPKDGLDYARAILNQGSAHLILAEFGVETEKNYQIAEKLYIIGTNIFYEVRDGWSYPIAILDIYTLYRSIFWKNGDKSFLKKANDSLKEAKKNIETWDVLRKNKLLGALYSVEADLCELDEDYYNAGIKYCDAYRLTKNLYYKFMYEFCEAKSSRKEKPFCQLIAKWEKHNKKTIFLDFYDYAVFECHLEEALENEALRFDEINAAKSKLDEIYSRTQIYHVKTRVGAYIDIINAYLNYFPEKDEEIDEEKAKQNIFSACKIFKSQGYLHEVEVCNLFSKAIKNKDSQEVWLGLIKNNLSNNLSKLIGEAAINELTKSQTRGIKADLGEIKVGVKEIKKSLDELKSDLITRFENIEKDIGDITQGDEVLRNLLIGYANKTHGILNDLLDESKKSDSRTQEFTREFSENITKKLEERDDRWLEKLKDELIKNEKEIEEKMPSAPPEIKSKWHLWIDKLRKELTETIRDIPHEAVVYVSAEKILEYGIPFLSVAIGSPYAIPALIAILTTMHMVLPEPKDE